MELVFTVNKIDTQADHKSVHQIHYTMSGTDDNGKTGSIKNTIGFRLKESSAEGFIPFENITESNAKDWIKFALTPTHIDDDGNETDTDLWPEVQAQLVMQIERAIAEEEAKNETNLPWA